MATGALLIIHAQHVGLYMFHMRQGDNRVEISCEDVEGEEDLIKSALEVLVKKYSNRVLFRNILFAVGPINGRLEFGEFQISSLPHDAPKPGLQIAPHPLLCEYFIEGSGDFRVDSLRAQRRFEEIFHFLALICIPVTAHAAQVCDTHLGVRRC